MNEEKVNQAVGQATELVEILTRLFEIGQATGIYTPEDVAAGREAIKQFSRIGIGPMATGFMLGRTVDTPHDATMMLGLIREAEEQEAA